MPDLLPYDLHDAAPCGDGPQASTYVSCSTATAEDALATDYARSRFAAVAVEQETPAPIWPADDVSERHGRGTAVAA